MSENFLFNPNTFKGEQLDPKGRDIIRKNIEYWEGIGLRNLKQDDVDWRYDHNYLKHNKDNQILATLMTPKGYGAADSSFELRRLTEYNESLMFYSAAARYIMQCTLIGSSPVWVGDNEGLKHKAAELLQDGHIFGFGCSEKTHGADLYSTETTVTPLGDGKYTINGEKYYIGNSNLGYISTFAKVKDTDDFMFVLVDSQNKHYNNKKQIKVSYMHGAYVGEFHLVDYPITDDDISSRGEKAWADAFATINIGKFQVGVSPIGMCTHAFYECLHHSYNRWLYGARVTDMPHVRKFFVEAYLRTVGMRLYAYRAIDYFRSCSETDRRYLLYNPINKTKTAQEGRDVINLLWDAVTARGFEVETYMESVTRDIQSSVKLEGTAHVNLSLILKFMHNYLLEPSDYPELGILEGRDDSAIFHQKLGKMSDITFGDYKRSLKMRNLANVAVFEKQAAALAKLFADAAPTKAQSKNMDYMLNLGMMFSTIPYAQLILEGSKLYDIDDGIVNQVFAFYVNDMARYAVNQMFSQRNTAQQEACLKKILSFKPVFDDQEYDNVWKETIVPLQDAYIQKQ